jgi:hypothetical protein
MDQDQMYQNMIEEKKAEYWNNVLSSQYIFEVTKCCGYSTFITVFKNRNMYEIFRCVEDTFQIYKNNYNSTGYNSTGYNSTGYNSTGYNSTGYNSTGYEYNLYVLHRETNEHMFLPRTLDMPIKVYIQENIPYFTPIYPIPTTVIYRIYIDDGHHCTNNGCAGIQKI